jgi:hypothetical protein
MSKIPLRKGLKWSDLSDDAKQGLSMLERAMDDPKVKLATRALNVWSNSLTTEEQHWLRHTEAGRKEIWRRMGLAHELCSPLKVSLPSS